MVKGNKQTTNTATEIKEMRALIEKLFGELNARQDKFDQTISELKESIQSSKAQQKSHENSSKGHGKTITATGPNESQAKGSCLFRKKSTHGGKCSNKKQVSLIEDDDEDVFDVPTVEPVTSEEKETDMAISVDAIVEYHNSKPYEGCCVTGYHGKTPLTVLMGLGGTSHNFINESLADKLGCDSFPVKPRNVRSAFGTFVTSRACKNFQLSLQGTVFNLDVYLLPLSSNCDMVLGNPWIKSLEKCIIGNGGVEFYFQGKKQFMSFNKAVGGSKR
ncbi:uncharacterized protein LOC132056373 [Lycium ferocissimum]|uniref:uncharacterized protein LOC132056373 n=1 Tax=Lycium ferocissimum TaxID=112874 RepID=UPI00281658F9|nr:uncharacterized protein LOC132056373 [Lycium ferocissimum]